MQDIEVQAEVKAEEKRGVRALIGVILLIVVLTGGSALAISIYMFSIGGFDRDLEGAAKISPSEFKGPMLEQAEGEELARVRAKEEKLLHQYGWVDRGQQLGRVPIEVAMQAIIQGASTSTTQRGAP
jgi:hypothetical protein